MTISFMSFFQPKPHPKPQPAELSVVSLARDVDVEGRTLPRGTRGTIVHAYKDGIGIEVEFDHPFHAVVTLQTSDLTI